MLTFLRIIKFAFQHFWRNIWLSLITVSMLLLTLLTINILIVINQVTDTAIQSVENKIDFSVYFEPEPEEDTVMNAAGYLRGLDQLGDVEVVTADEELERFREGDQDEATISA